MAEITEKCYFQNNESKIKINVNNTRLANLTTRQSIKPAPYIVKWKSYAFQNENVFSIKFKIGNASEWLLCEHSIWHHIYHKTIYEQYYGKIYRAPRQCEKKSDMSPPLVFIEYCLLILGVLERRRNKWKETCKDSLTFNLYT